MTAKILYLSIALASTALVLGYILSDWWMMVPPIIALGVLWVLGMRRGWAWVAPVGLIVVAVVAALGLWQGLGPGWMLCALVAALSAWDLDHFGRQLRAAPQVIGWSELERRHLLRLLAVDALGLLLGAVALLVRIRLEFGWILLLGVLAALALTRAIASLRRESD